MIDHKICRICNSLVSLRCSDQPGYRNSEVYQVYYCMQCNTSFADPMIVSDEVYEMIYANRQNISGYGRYERYARDIVFEKDPLRYLADSDDVYWGIERYFSDRKSSSDLSVLDVGSGLGYLTYALSKRGFQVTGVDLSHIAVESARRAYGDYFINADIGDIAQSSDHRYDVAVLAEIIEHIPDIHDTLRKVSDLLKPNGEIVITTPNRSIYSVDVIWDTDPPPVHFWWLSEQSISQIANDMNFSVRFIDFTEFNRKNYLMYHKKVPDNVVTRYSILDRDGNPIGSNERFTSMLSGLFERFGLRKMVRSAYFSAWRLMTGLYLARRSVDLRSGSKMCAILTKKRSE